MNFKKKKRHSLKLSSLRWLQFKKLNYSIQGRTGFEERQN